jgi:hypothetical protein
MLISLPVVSRCLVLHHLFHSPGHILGHYIFDKKIRHTLGNTLIDTLIDTLAAHQHPNILSATLLLTLSPSGLRSEWYSPASIISYLYGWSLLLNDDQKMSSRLSEITILW